MSERAYFEQFSGYNPDDEHEPIIIKSNADLKHFISIVRREWAKQHGL